MYLRRTTRRVGTKTYQNYLLVESVATPKGPRQRVICSLGALAPGPKEEWLGTARRLHAAGEDTPALEAKIPAGERFTASAALLCPLAAHFSSSARA